MQWYYWQAEQGEGIQVQEMHKWCSCTVKWTGSNFTGYGPKTGVRWSFPLLGGQDMIGVGGGAEDASRARVRCAWAKFRELAPILTSRETSLRVKGKI